MEQVGRQPETELNPRAEAFLRAMDYPEAAEHQAQFDAMVDEAMQRLPEAYKTPFKLGTDIIHWGLWPSADVPYGFESENWRRHRNQDLKPEMEAPLSWSVSVLQTLNLDTLTEAIQEARKPKEATVRELVKEQARDNPAYEHISTFNSKTNNASERPLNYIEKIAATAVLRHTIATQADIPLSELRTDRSPAGRQLRGGLYQIDEGTIIGRNVTHAQPHDRLWGFLTRSALASNELSPDKCTSEFIKQAMADAPGSIPDELLYAGCGAQSLLNDPEQSSPSIVAGYFCDLLDGLIKGLEAGADFDSALESGLEALTDEYMYGLTHPGHLSEPYFYEPKLLMLQLRNLPGMPAGMLPDLEYPIAGEDPFPANTTYNKPAKTTLAPGATVSRATYPRSK